MGFEDMLRQKLGPMRDLVRLSRKPEPPAFDPATLYYRRAVGLEVRVRPEETWSSLQVGRIDRGDRPPVVLDAEIAGVMLGLTRWRHASELEREGLSSRELWRLVSEDLLFFSTRDPGVRLSGEGGALARAGETGRLARRRSMWPTLAVETALAIAPMPFMPRGDDLRGAEAVGMRFAGLERGFEVIGVTITGTKRTGALLRALVPLLDGRRTRAEILDAFPAARRRDAENALELLDRATILEVVAGAPPPSQALESPRGAQVTWLGHAAVFFQSAGKNILVDPLFFSKSDPEERFAGVPKPDPRALPRVDAVLITHGDNDHLNVSSLAQLPPETPVYIPRIGDFPPKYQVDLRGVLSVLGFTRVLEIDEGSGVAIGDVVVTACPFQGEDWGLDLAKCTYLVESEDASVFFGADAHRMDEVYAELAARGRPIDLAFMGVSGSAETFAMPDGFGYGNFYREWIPRVRHNEWVEHCASPRDVLHALEILKPRFAFGYAAGGAPWIRTEYSDTGDHEALAALVEAANREAGLETRAVALPLGEPVAIAALAALAPPLSA